MQVGFIGLGTMGKPMALRLLAAGHRLRVWNRSPGPMEELRRAGAEIAANAREAYRGEAVISMLSDDAALRQIVIDGEVLPKGGTATIHVNMATISPSFAKELAAFHAARGAPYVAAPVFGLPPVAAAGRLNIVAAGAADLIDRVQPLFDAMGQKTWRLGAEPSRANVVKIAGNFMIVAAIEAMAEATALVQAHGVPPADLFAVVTHAPFSCPPYQHYSAGMVARRYEPASFKVSLALKDLQLALDAAQAAHVPLPLGEIVRDSFVEAVGQGRDAHDASALAEVALRRAGVG
jgi:3-hydroxyisobutyrate dehydrogenase-like beta-hydroxyacid dehydrogenase